MDKKYSIGEYTNKEGISIRTNASSILDNVIQDIEGIKDFANNYAKAISETFRDEARGRLKNSKYKNASHLANNIVSRKPTSPTNLYRVEIDRTAPQEEKDAMIYLEFGTGFVGRKNPHPDASKYGWSYAVNEGSEWYFNTDDFSTYSKSNDSFKPTGISNKTEEPVGKEGWFYRDEHGQLHATSGLYAVQYIHGTIDDIDNIMKRAEEKARNERTTPRHRIVRK